MLIIVLLLILVFSSIFLLVSKPKKKAIVTRTNNNDYIQILNQERKKQIQILEQQAYDGDESSAVVLAKRYEKTNIQLALKWYLVAAKLNNTYSQKRLVEIISNSVISTSTDEQKAYYLLYLFRYSEEKTTKFKCCASILESHYKRKNIVIEVTTYLTELCNEDDIDAITLLSEWLVSKNNEKPDPRFSTNLLFSSAKKHDTLSMKKLGVHYLEGVGTKVDSLKGLYWLERAAETGDVDAMTFLAKTWSNEYHKNYPVALFWSSLGGYLSDEKVVIKNQHLMKEVDVKSVIEIQKLCKQLSLFMKKNPLKADSLIYILNQFLRRKDFDPKLLSIFENSREENSDSHETNFLSS
ncbi:hypothetical protein [Vibrio sp. CyArs1]|uniref:tetratricopeptide repeat protein n=1 Tax=Vibrio sp. CyArs1 TaxID=2682577 RepID=UPI001F05745E|nr:hypothetical protein [Vibrio sp. CyArs1]